MSQQQIILITGATGFVGRHLIPAVRDFFADYRVIGTSREPRTGFEQLDFTDSTRISGVVQTLRPIACIHLAAVASLSQAAEDQEHAWRVNLHGTIALAGALRQFSPECLLIYVSSSEVYGDTFRSGVALDEKAQLAPRNLYAATKAAADVALSAFTGPDLRTIRVRPFNHTGPGQSSGFVVPDFARQIALIANRLQEPVIHTGALDVERDFLDVRDVCAAYLACLRLVNLKGPFPAVVNIASGIPRRVGDILNDLLRISKVEAIVRPLQKLYRSSDVMTAAGDSQVARSKLGWAPVIDWQQTLADVMDDWQKRVV